MDELNVDTHISIELSDFVSLEQFWFSSCYSWSFLYYMRLL